MRHREMTIKESFTITGVMDNTKVFFPCYGGCEFESLEEAVNHVQQTRGGLSVYIDKIVMYNICFRDCLRMHGIEGVINMLIEEAPAIAQDTKALNVLRSKWKNEMNEHIADYDIQCLPKDSPMFIRGSWFKGLEDIKSYVETSGNPRHRFARWIRREEYKRHPSVLHVGNIWESYPMFDSSDASDGRSYNNYIISCNPLVEPMMEIYCSQVSVHSNFCMVHEDIPPYLLPILYYDGDSDYVLLATAKDKRRKGSLSPRYMKYSIQIS